ncbi:sensor histidine kinase [Haloplanus sp. C73]|uniref:sensor histidine kinase n=1 Tax=Haloplanus sp. C73 TaxID=3421641 RepID=UPI003EBFFB08
MSGPVRHLRSRRLLAGGSVSLLGCLLLGVPLFDIWDDATNLSWSVLTSLAENALFFVLASALVWGGVWLARSDWGTDRVTVVAKRTVLATLVFAGLIAWAAYLQLQVMGALKPQILAMDGVIIGAVTSFGISIASTRADVYRAAADEERALKESLELLYRIANELEGATTHEEVYGITDHGLDDVFGATPVRVVIDETVVIDADAPDCQPSERVPIGERGYIELWGDDFARHDVTTAELFGTHLDEAIRRIERETRLREERDILEFVNRTLRHDLLGDLSLVEARLRMLDRNVVFEDPAHADHLDVSLDRVDDMHEFIRTMRTYMEALLDADHSLEATPLPPVIDEELEDIREAHPDAVAERSAIPEVAVEADDLLSHVFSNLFRNAVEHNDAETPEVIVDAELAGDVVCVTVADNGPGVPESRRKDIFEKGAHGTESSGSGFGLFLVKDAVENYGGEIRVRDNEPRGTVFELELPVASG